MVHHGHRQCIEGYDFVLNVLRSRQSTVAADEQPVDEQWLESLGFTKHTGFLPSPWTVYASPSFELQFQVEKNKWTFKLHTIQSPANRGDFLQLCRLLNIATPIGQEEGK